MRPFSTIVAPLLLAIALLGLLLGVDPIARALGTPAPAGTPLTGTPAAAPGRTVLLQAVLGEPPEAPAVVRLSRLTIDPDAELPEVGGTDPTFLVMESGRVSVTVDGAAVRLRATGGDADARSVPLVMVPFTFASGGQLALPAGTTASLVNPGDERATLLVVTLEAIGSAVAGTPQPVATPVATSRGTTVQPLGEGRIDDLPRGRLAVTLERFSLVTGLGVPAYPGPVLVAVERGGFNSTLDAGEVQVWRGAAAGSIPEIPEGGAFTVAAGDALFFPKGMEPTPPLEGDGALILLRLGILPLPAMPEAADETGSLVVVTRDEVNLRSGPSTADSAIAGLVAGQTLLVTGPPVEGDGRLWYPVRDPVDPALAGYVAAEFLAPAP